MHRKIMWGSTETTAHVTRGFPTRRRRRWTAICRHRGSRVDFRHPQFFDFCNKIGPGPPTCALHKVVSGTLPGRQQPEVFFACKNRTITIV
jgi:hypothetical protein